MSDAIHGHGTTLTLGGTAIGNIINIGGPEQSRDSLDVSTMDSSAKWREFIPGMLDAGEVTIEINYDGTTLGTANLLYAQFTASANTLIITVPAQGTHSTSSWSVSSFMTGLGAAIPFDDKVTQSVTFKLTGPVAYTDSAN